MVRVEHLSDDQIRAYRLADNRLAELSGWDRDILEIELQHLSSVELDFNIETIGWEHAELDLLLDPEKEEIGDPADEGAPAPEAVPITRLGELWLMDKHRLYCGSSLEAEAFGALMDGQMASMVFQDAPYNVPISGHVGGLGNTKHREFAMASGEMTNHQFLAFLTDNAKLVAENVIDGAVVQMCMDWRSAKPAPETLDEHRSSRLASAGLQILPAYGFCRVSPE